MAEHLWLKVSVSRYDGYLYIAPETEAFIFMWPVCVQWPYCSSTLSQKYSAQFAVSYISAT